MGDQDDEIKEEEVADFNPLEKNEFDEAEDLPDEIPHPDENEVVDEDPLRKTTITLDEAEAEEGGDDNDSFDDVDDL